MKNALLVGMLILLGGCASQPCDESVSGNACHAERLLYQNDLMQAKILIAIGNEEGYELAHALLDRSARFDERGEIEFYKALLLIRQGPQQSEVLRLLEEARAKGHAHAVALLYKIYDEPYLIEQRDAQKAEQYRAEYELLDVAQSGYPSFDKALELITELVEPPPSPAERELICPAVCQ